jgi:hypothetical protein
MRPGRAAIEGARLAPVTLLAPGRVVPDLCLISTCGNQVAVPRGFYSTNL